MKRRNFCWSIGIFLCISWGACSSTGEENQKQKKIQKPTAVVVDLTKVHSTQITEEVEVVGTLTPKFETAVKSEYTGRPIRMRRISGGGGWGGRRHGDGGVYSWGIEANLLGSHGKSLECGSNSDFGNENDSH